MLRLTANFLITGLLFLYAALCATESGASLTQITNTSEHAVNLNPTLSDNGKIVVFESSADLLGSGQSSSFLAVRAELRAQGAVFRALGNTRLVSPALSSDGKIIVFASTEDLVGQNVDRNSEIFLFDGTQLKQVTVTEPTSNMSRLSDGNFQPSVTADGRMIAFSSNRDLGGLNGDLSYEIFVYSVDHSVDHSVNCGFTQLTNDTNEHS